jgi:hypothetical protein
MEPWSLRQYGKSLNSYNVYKELRGGDPGNLNFDAGSRAPSGVSDPVDSYNKRFELLDWIKTERIAYSDNPEQDPKRIISSDNPELDPDFDPCLNVRRCGSPFILNIRNTRNNFDTNLTWTYPLPLPKQDLNSILRVIDINHDLLAQLHKLHNITLLDFNDLLANPPKKFEEYVKRLGYGYLADNAEIDEIRPVRAKICVNGKVVYVPNYSRKNELIKKLISRRSSVSRLINRIYELSSKVGSDYMLNFTLTVPIWLINPDNIEKELKKVKKAFREFIKRLESKFYYGSKLGGCYNVHIWSSDKLTPYIHIHMHMLNVCQDKNGEFHRFRPYFSKEQLETIRTLWKKCLRKSGYSIAKDVELDVYIDYVKLGNRPLVFHKLKYSVRSPLIDLVRYFIVNDREPEISDEWAEILIFYENRRSVFGFFRNLKQLIGEVRKTRNCPVCGSEIDEYTECLNYVEWENMFRDGKMIIVFFDPKTRKMKAIVNGAREEGMTLELLYACQVGKRA